MNEPIPDIAEEKISPEEKKRLYMKNYMRQYKKKKYDEDAESFRRANRTRYLKKTRGEGIDNDDKTRYGNYLADVIAVREIILRLPDNIVRDLLPVRE
jgi:hypothetical protein